MPKKESEKSITGIGPGLPDYSKRLLGDQLLAVAQQTDGILRMVGSVESQLTGLEINTNKDWDGYRITNLGAPVSAKDSLRYGDEAYIDHNLLKNYLAAKHLTLPNTIANVLSDHNLAGHPLSVIPTMNDAHIPDIDTLSYGAAFAAAQIPTLDADKIGTGRLALARLPAGAADKAIIGQGAGSDPVYGDPIPKATDESGSFTWDTSSYTTTEVDISALFTTALTGTTRRKYSVMLDLTGPAGDSASWTSCTVKVKVAVDGTNYRTIDKKALAKTDVAATAEPGVPIDIPAVVQNVRITIQFDVALAGDQTIYYSYVKEHLE